MAASIVFPAFVNEYKGTENRINRDIGNTFMRLLESASGYLNTDLTGFDFRRNNFLEDELKSQYISYIFSCSVAGFLKNKNFSPSFVSGYSMGIYAALHYCGSVDFLQGIKMIKQAWEILCRATEGGRFVMGMIIGLNETDLGTLIQDRKEIEISNQNNPYTFILSGTRQAIEIVLEAAREAGAMRISLLPVSKPYHSRFLKRASPEFAEAIGDIDFMPPLYPYISAMDQNMITTGDGLRKEVIVNLSSRMNWMKTMNSLVSNGSDRIFECGAGDGLTRNARFIEGEFQSFSVDKLEKFIESAADK
ncbi:MAG: Malonyl CoA-acyl carrier protein transacylase [Bacteroidetes bacterium]|nr:Malonyl CoA-acyl carrier protein transacylase [Bacteroidota bacterium]